MALQAGTRLGPYEIQAPLGAGGMGEVYRARDVKLNRDVAIKVLPEAFGSDADRVNRLEREAQTLAALNHPNIAQVFGIVEQPLAVVMELVEGVDLSTRTGPSGMALDDAVPIARQIAEALEAAHERGIVHRDLKPANVKLRPDGVAKVLDFGLAKAIDPGDVARRFVSGAAPGDANTGDALANSPTFTSPVMTHMGVILGTAAYMSPEQARGKPVDKRTDIWAFGCVLFEMLSGRAAFDGDTIADVLGAIVYKSPDLTRLPAATPAAIRSLIERCLIKDVARRLRDIGEARIVLEDPQKLAAPAAAAGSSSRVRGPLVAAVVVATAVMTWTAAYLARPQPPEPVLRKSHVVVKGDGAGVNLPVISPDGRRIVYMSRSRLWVQPIDGWNPRELAGTEGGTRPFWSRDSEWIVFFRSEQLLKVPAAGGPVVQVATLPAVQAPLNAGSGVWTKDGSLILSMAADEIVYRVPSAGGELKEFFRLPKEIGLDLHDLSPLPDGALLATVHQTEGIAGIGVLANGTFKVVLDASNVSRPRYAPSGHIIYSRQAPNAGLWALPFSLDEHAPAGDPFLIGQGTDPSVADDGTLVYRADAEAVTRQLAWFSVDGKAGAAIAAPQDWTEGVALSPDGKQLLAAASDGIWSYNLATGARSRITTGRTDITPQWIGTTGDIVFVRSVAGRPALFTKRADAGGDERSLIENARFPTVAKDGRRIVFNRRLPGELTWRVGWLDLDAPTKINQLPSAHDGARFPVVSPDGRFVAYISGEMGRDEVFLTRLPGGAGKVQVSANGGGWCRFSAKGDGIVYRTAGGDFMKAAFNGQDDLGVAPPQRLFEWGPAWALFYELAPDGVRGVTAMPVSKTSSVTSLSLVQNWHLEFARR